MARTKTNTPNSEPEMADAKLIRANVDKQTELLLDKWGKEEGRSLQTHAGILLRRLAALAKSQPEELHKLGLLSPLIKVA